MNKNIPQMKNPPPPPPPPIWDNITAETIRDIHAKKTLSLGAILMSIHLQLKYAGNKKVVFDDYEISNEVEQELIKRGFTVKRETVFFFWEKVVISC
jgi:hypothetical protein